MSERITCRQCGESYDPSKPEETMHHMHLPVTPESKPQRKVGPPPAGPLAPALTADEWKNPKKLLVQALHVRLDRPGFPDHMLLHVGGDASNFALFTDEEVIGFPYHESRHAIGALALYEHAHGFTHEDVESLRQAAFELRSDTSPRQRAHVEESVPYHLALAHRLEALADRVAALLPPRPA